MYNKIEQFFLGLLMLLYVAFDIGWPLIVLVLMLLGGVGYLVFWR